MAFTLCSDEFHLSLFSVDHVVFLSQVTSYIKGIYWSLKSTNSSIRFKVTPSGHFVHQTKVFYSSYRFSKTDVKAQLNGYATDPFLRSRWDTIQKEFRCCGGYNVGTGYQDWEGVSIDPLPIGANPAALVTGKNTSPKILFFKIYIAI